MDDCVERREDILPLFENEDVLIEKASCVSWDDDNTAVRSDVLYIRPTEKYNSDTAYNYLIKIIFDYLGKCKAIQTVGKVKFNLETERIECYGEAVVGALTKTIISSILSDYNAACENFRKYHKNRKIAEIKGICDKFTV